MAYYNERAEMILFIFLSSAQNPINYRTGLWEEFVLSGSDIQFLNEADNFIHDCDLLAAVALGASSSSLWPGPARLNLKSVNFSLINFFMTACDERCVGVVKGRGLIVKSRLFQITNRDCL